MLFVPLGSTNQIGASCHYLNIAGTGLLLDAGYDPEQDGMAGVPHLNLLEKNAEWPVDHVLLTHAHHDHIGSLPVVLQRMPHALVHMTEPTRRLLEMLLPASARLQRRKRMEGSSLHDPIFTKEQTEALSFLYEGYDLDRPFELNGLNGFGPVTVTFYHAGHVLGAAGILLEFDENGSRRRVFYTSDTNLRPQTIHPGGEYPEGPIDVLILESTLGADPQAEHSQRRPSEKALGEAIERTLLRGGTVLIPVFALGRAQEIIALIGRYKKRGVIPEDIPVYTAGSMRGIADLYDQTRYTSPRLDPDFEVYGVSQKRLPRNRERLQSILQEPSIHIAASGMMFERTLSNRIAQKLIGDSKNAIFFVGFMKDGCPGDLLLKAAQNGAGTKIKLSTDQEPKPVLCQVDRYRLSGHSHRRDLIQLVEMMQPKKVVLVHGEEPAREWMSDNIKFFYPDVEVIRPQQGVPAEV